MHSLSRLLAYFPPVDWNVNNGWRSSSHLGPWRGPWWSKKGEPRPSVLLGNMVRPGLLWFRWKKKKVLLANLSYVNKGFTPFAPKPHCSWSVLYQVILTGQYMVWVGEKQSLLSDSVILQLVDQTTEPHLNNGGRTCSAWTLLRSSSSCSSSLQYRGGERCCHFLRFFHFLPSAFHQVSLLFGSKKANFLIIPFRVL